MNLTSIQERRLTQVKAEISFLEKEVEKKNLFYAVRTSLIVMLAGFLAGYLFALLIENKSLQAYVHDYGWLKFFTEWLFWFFVMYFLFIRSNRQQLKLKKKEFAELQVRYGLVEETAA